MATRPQDDNPDGSVTRGAIQRTGNHYLRRTCANHINAAYPESSRERSLAFTKLDEMIMWLDKATEHNE